MSVSVIVLAHQAAKTLQQALNSVLAQQVPLADLFIADLGSTDSTAHLAAEFCEKIPGARLQLFARRSGAAALNAGLDQCTGDFVAFLNAADAWVPGKLARQCEALQTHKFLGGMATHVNYIDAQGDPLLPSKSIPRYNAPGDKVLHLRRLLCDVDALSFSSVLLRRSICAPVGRFDEGLLYHGPHDYWLRLHTLSALRVLPEPLTQMRCPRPQALDDDPLAACREAWEVLGRHAGKLLTRFKPLVAHAEALYDALIYYAYRGQDFTAAEKYLRAKKSMSELNRSEALCLVDCQMHMQNFEGAHEILQQLQTQRASFSSQERARLDELIWHLLGAGHLLVDPFECSIGMGLPNGQFVVKSQRLPEALPA